MTRPEDLAYLKGYSDGWETVTQLTQRLWLAYCLIAVLSGVIIWQFVGRQAQWTN